MPCAFFDRFHALLQFQHFGFEDTVALQQVFILALLRGYLPLQLGNFRQAAIAHPQPVLQPAKQQNQHQEQPVG